MPLIGHTVRALHKCMHQTRLSVELPVEEFIRRGCTTTNMQGTTNALRHHRRPGRWPSGSGLHRQLCRLCAAVASHRHCFRRATLLLGLGVHQAALHAHALWPSVTVILSPWQLPFLWDMTVDAKTRLSHRKTWHSSSHAVESQAVRKIPRLLPQKYL